MTGRRSAIEHQHNNQLWPCRSRYVRGDRAPIRTFEPDTTTPQEFGHGNEIGAHHENAIVDTYADQIDKNRERCPECKAPQCVEHWWHWNPASKLIR